MRQSGTLRSWRDDQGFGFIAPTQGVAELFVHISTLPKDGTRPTVGERLTYELGRGRNGKPQAVNVQRQAIGQMTQQVFVPKARAQKRRSVAPNLVGLILLTALAAYGFSKYQERALYISSKIDPPSMSSVSGAATVAATAAPGFNCDDRIYCSQMTSCTEAKFFLKNCPGAKMDGDGDGIPCEQQWCTHPQAE